jgi:hypothetical protein
MTPLCAHRCIFFWTILFACFATGWSQEQTTQQPASTQGQTSPQQPATAKADQKQTQSAPAKGDDQDELNVNWLYGAYVPKGVPLKPLTGNERWKLYVRESFTTPGIYVKIVLFTASDQIFNNPKEWGRNWGGFGKRLASREGQFVIQNSFSSLGDALLQYEPRYDRCNCSGFWPRTKHAVVRNFVTYNKTEQALRPQYASYGAALGAGMMTSLWKPGESAWTEGYHGVITQVWAGVAGNWIGEFAPEISRVLHRGKKPKTSK